CHHAPHPTGGKICLYTELAIVHGKRIEISISTKAGKVDQMEAKTVIGLLAEIIRRVKGEFLQDDFYPFMGIGLDQLVDFGKYMVNQIQQDILVLIVTMKVIEFAQIYGEQDSLAGRMLLDPGRIMPGRLLPADDLWWARNAGCIDGQVGIVRS